MRAAFLLALCLALSFPARATSPDAAVVAPGHATVPLTGPWRFHTGDDAQWSAPGFDDSAWETVDLTPAPGAHDGDVGLPGYVTGWSKRGHAGYSGYAWYRLRVTVGSDEPLALAGPTLVDSTYELYVDGKRVGGPGDFSGATPRVFSVRPAVYALPPRTAAGPVTYQLAMRVWMDPLDASEESGGLHVAPAIGTVEGINQLYQVQWLQTFKGYVVDAIEPLAFCVLALMVVALVACRSDDTYRWLVTALVLLALMRVQQVMFYWTPFLSLRWYDVLVTVICRPLVLASWTLAWRDWFRLGRKPAVGYAVAALTVAYLLLALLGRPWLIASPGVRSAADLGVTGVRWLFAAVYLWTIGAGLARGALPARMVSALAALLVGIGLFATELNALGIPGIWFPYGTGVARGQYAYAAFVIVLFVLILLRAVGYGRRAKDRLPHQ